MGVVMGLLPVTGIPLTFISFGGSSLVVSMFCIGVLLNISKDRSK
jgi:cell division protein FtsW